MEGFDLNQVFPTGVHPPLCFGAFLSSYNRFLHNFYTRCTKSFIERYPFPSKLSGGKSDFVHFSKVLSSSCFARIHFFNIRLLHIIFTPVALYIYFSLPSNVVSIKQILTKRDTCFYWSFQDLYLEFYVIGAAVVLW